MTASLIPAGTGGEQTPHRKEPERPNQEPFFTLSWGCKPLHLRPAWGQNTVNWKPDGKLMSEKKYCQMQLQQCIKKRHEVKETLSWQLLTWTEHQNSGSGRSTGTTRVALLLIAPSLSLWDSSLFPVIVLEWRGKRKNPSGHAAQLNRLSHRMAVHSFTSLIYSLYKGYLLLLWILII